MANVSRMMVDLDKLLALVDRRIDQAMREGKTRKPQRMWSVPLKALAGPFAWAQIRSGGSAASRQSKRPSWLNA
jgi:hypothetical protein